MRKSYGFMLIEIVVCMVLLGISALGVFGFIGMGSQFFAEDAARNQAASFTRNMIHRISREVQGSVPYQISISNNADGIQELSFIKPVYSLRVYQRVSDTIYLYNGKNIGFSCSSSIGNSEKQASSVAFLKDDGSLIQYKIGTGNCSIDGNFISISLSGMPDEFNVDRIYFLNAWSKTAYTTDSNGYLYCRRNGKSEIVNAGGRNKVRALKFETTDGTKSSFGVGLNSVLMGIFTVTDGENISVSHLLEIENVF